MTLKINKKLILFKQIIIIFSLSTTLTSPVYSAIETVQPEPENTIICVNPLWQNSALRWAVALNGYTMGGEGLFLDRDLDLAPKYRPLNLLPRMQHGIYKAPDSGALAATGLRTDILKLQVSFPQPGDNKAWTGAAVHRLYDFQQLEKAVLASLQKMPSLSIKIQGIGVGGALANQFASHLLHQGLSGNRIQLLMVDTPTRLLSAGLLAQAKQGNSRDLKYSAAYCSSLVADKTQ